MGFTLPRQAQAVHGVADFGQQACFAIELFDLGQTQVGIDAAGTPFAPRYSQSVPFSLRYAFAIATARQSRATHRLSLESVFWPSAFRVSPHFNRA